MISAKDLSNKIDCVKVLSKKPNKELQKKIVEDYYKFSNDSWEKSHSIPKKYSAWSSFHIINEINKKRINAIVEKTVSKKKLSHNEKLIKNFYLAGMDTKNIEKEGISRIIPYLNMIDGIFSLSDYIQILPFFHLLEVVPVFRFYPVIDSKDPTKYRLHFFEGELGLPSRDYFLEKRHAKTVKKYNKYLNDVAKLFNLSCDNKEIDKVILFEKTLAKAYLPPEEKRDVNKNYNIKSIKSLNDDVISFTDYITMLSNMTNVDLTAQNEIIVGNIGVVKKIRQILKKTDIEILKLHLKFNFIKDYAVFLTKEAQDLHFNFYKKTLYGVKEQKPRKETVIDDINSHLWDCVGEQYVKSYFPESSKKSVIKLVKKLVKSYGKKLVECEWMSSSTKKYALHKLDKMTLKMGYPSKIIDYSSLSLGCHYFENAMEVTKFISTREFNKLLKPVDKAFWEMSAQTCNAYYYPQLNEIVFPAGILQEPFYDPKQSDGENFGGIGAIIGHEITHGFDDQGKEFNADGFLKKWWTKSDDENYSTRAKKVSQHMSAYKLHGHNINGDLTLGETIADLGGVKIGFEALMDDCQDKKLSSSETFKQQQMFFLNWARVWRKLATKEYIVNRILSDPHPPAVLRVNAILKNSPDFYKTYGVNGDDELYNKEMTKIW